MGPETFLPVATVVSGRKIVSALKQKQLRWVSLLVSRFTSSSSFRFGSEVVQRRVIVKSENVFEKVFLCVCVSLFSPGCSGSSC